MRIALNAVLAAHRAARCAVQSVGGETLWSVTHPSVLQELGNTWSKSSNRGQEVGCSSRRGSADLSHSHVMSAEDFEVRHVRIDELYHVIYHIQKAVSV